MQILKNVETPMLKKTDIINEVRVTFEASFAGTVEKYDRSFKYSPELFSRKEVFEEVKKHIATSTRSELTFTSCKVWTFVQAKEGYFDGDVCIKERDIEIFLFDGTLSEKKSNDKPLDIIKLAQKSITKAPLNC